MAKVIEVNQDEHSTIFKRTSQGISIEFQQLTQVLVRHFGCLTTLASWRTDRATADVAVPVAAFTGNANDTGGAATLFEGDTFVWSRSGHSGGGEDGDNDGGDELHFDKSFVVEEEVDFFIRV
ncbi:hypothetical protein TWF718_005118 [Orbilia javanica]|uniref:Uncharacterized protein n=1 Tax=Orbilia javanica TaxID=47235 RepID=A0AAN8RFI3_9PEZI